MRKGHRPPLRPLLVLPLPLIAVLFASCSANREGSLYRAERQAWGASRLEANLQIAPDTPPTLEETGKVLNAYRRLLELSRAPAGAIAAQDSTMLRSFGRLRAQAQLGMVRMHRYRGEAAEARALLESARREHQSDLPVRLRLYRELADECLAVGDVEGAANVYREIGFELPVRTEDGQALFTVLDAPIRAADLLFEIGRSEQARELLREARGRYRALIEAGGEDEAAAVSWIELGNIAARLGDHEEAVAATAQAQRLASSPMVRARALFIYGLLNQEGARDLDAAIAAYREFLDEFPADRNAPEALLRIALCQLAQQRYDEVLEAVERLRKEHPRARWAEVRGSLLAARVHVLAGRWPDALREYRSLISKHPTSPQALIAPFEIADYYRSIGERDVERHTLERAIAEFDRLQEANQSPRVARLIEEKAIQALMRLQRWEESVTRLSALPSIDPENPRNAMALREAARIAAEELNDRDRADRILRQLIEEYPESPSSGEAGAQVER